MNHGRKLWPALLATILCLLCLGLTTTGNVVSREGLDGLFKRKRDAVRQVMPEALPVVDEVEERVRGNE